MPSADRAYARIECLLGWLARHVAESLNASVSGYRDIGAEKIYVLPTLDPTGRPGAIPKSALDAAMRGLGLLIDSRLKADIAHYAQDAELIVLPAPNRAGVQPTSFEHSARLITEALVVARTALASDTAGRHLRLIR